MFDALKRFEITKIDGQLVDEDINKLTTQITTALVTIKTKNRGGKLGCIGLSKDILPCPVESSSISQFAQEHSQKARDDTKTHDKHVAEHKEEITEFETYKACQAWAHQTILNAVDKEWISELKDEDLGYQLTEPLNFLEHLCDASGDLDEMEITNLNTQLERFGIPKQPEIRLSYTVATFQTSSQFDPAMCEWNACTLIIKTCVKFKVFIQHKYTKQVKQNRSTAGSVCKGIANRQWRRWNNESRMPRLKPLSLSRFQMCYKCRIKSK
ncbi:hypothetical protein ACHAW6_014128 [Cyclotella cf. meneghiniana]